MPHASKGSRYTFAGLSVVPHDISNLISRKGCCKICRSEEAKSCMTLHDIAWHRMILHDTREHLLARYGICEYGNVLWPQNMLARSVQALGVGPNLPVPQGEVQSCRQRRWRHCKRVEEMLKWRQILTSNCQNESKNGSSMNSRKPWPRRVSRPTQWYKHND